MLTTHQKLVMLNNWRAFSTIGGVLTTHQKLVMLDNWREFSTIGGMLTTHQKLVMLDNWRAGFDEPVECYVRE